jgi:hypothetical protein
MFVIRKLLIVCFLLIHLGLNSQTGFYKQYSSNGYDYGNGVYQTSDNGYLITGSSTSFTDGPSQIYLLKLDSLGIYQWSKHYGGNESDVGVRVKSIPGFGHFVVGYTNSSGNGAYDFVLLKTDESGTEQWQYTYGTAAWDRVYDAALTIDSGLIMVGETTNTLDGESDVYIVRTNNLGNPLWTKQIGNIGPDKAKCVIADIDSSFIICGQRYITDSSMYKGWVARYDKNGELIWEKYLGKNGNCVINDAVIDPNGEIALVGMVVRPQGDTLIFEGKGLPSGYFGIETQAKLDGVVYYEGLAKFGSSDRYVTVQRFDNQYSYGGFDLSMTQNYSGLSWEMNIGQVNYLHDELMGEVIQTNDKGAVVVGSITDSWMGGSNVFVFKFYYGQPFTNSNDNFTTEPIVSIVTKQVDNVAVYPNPVNDQLRISGNQLINGTIQLFSISGSLISELRVENNIVDVSQLQKGSYLMMMLDSDRSPMGRCMIIKN